MVDREIDPDRTFELLEDCSLFRTYKDAFRVATGLPLVLVRGDWPQWGPLLYPFALALVLCGLGLRLFRKHAGEMVD